MSVGVWSLQLGHGVDLLFAQQPGWTRPRTGSAPQPGAVGEGVLTIPRWGNSHEKTPAMVAEGLLWKEGRNCSIT